jgi:hypothetical protein
MTSPVSHIRVDPRTWYGRPRQVVAVLAVLLASCGSGNKERESGNAPTYTITAQVSGLEGSGLVLQMNSESMSVSTAGQVAFASRLTSAQAYSVNVTRAPTQPNQTCSVARASGTVASANITDVTVSCTTLGTGQISSLVTLDPALPVDVRARVASVVSPMSRAQVGDWLGISINTPTQSSLLLALNQDDELVLAAVTKDPRTQLSASTTALALVMLALDELPSDDWDNAITELEGSSGYAALVATIESELAAGHLPAASTSVLERILAVVLEVSSSRATAGASSRSNKISTPYLRAPYILIDDTLLGGDAISLGLGGGSLTNKTAIDWAFNTTDVNGAPLGSGVVDSRRGLLSTDAPLNLDRRGSSITVGQNLFTRLEAGSAVIALSVDAAMNFWNPQSCNTAGLKGSLQQYLQQNANMSSGFEGFMSSIQSIVSSADTYVSIAENCADGELRTLAKNLSKYFTALSKIQGAIAAGQAVATAAYLAEYWDAPSVTYGLCFDSLGRTNCASRIEFEPAEVEIAAGGGWADLPLKAYDANNNSIFPSGISCSSTSTSIVVDPVTCRVTSHQATTGGPYVVTANDEATGIQATAAVHLVVPVIVPAQSTIVPNSGIEIEVRSPSGRALNLPEFIWESDDPSELRLSRSPGLVANSSYWRNTPPQSPGVVNITTRYLESGLTFSQARITVEPSIATRVNFTLSATALPQGSQGTAVDGQGTFVFDPSVIPVSGSGTVVGITNNVFGPLSAIGTPFHPVSASVRVGSAVYDASNLYIRHLTFSNGQLVSWELGSEGVFQFPASASGGLIGGGLFDCVDQQLMITTGGVMLTVGGVKIMLTGGASSTTMAHLRQAGACNIGQGGWALQP